VWLGTLGSLVCSHSTQADGHLVSHQDASLFPIASEYVKMRFGHMPMVLLYSSASEAYQHTDETA
jgi:hypothetical protein